MKRLTKTAYALFLVALCFICCRHNPSGHLTVSGRFSGHEIYQVYNASYGILQVNDIEIKYGNSKTENYITFGGISLDDANSRGILKKGKFSLSDDPQNDSEIRAKIYVTKIGQDRVKKGYCIASYAQSGLLTIEDYNTSMITGSISLEYTNGDSLFCEFNIPLKDEMPKIPIPVRKMDGTTIKHIEISDQFPHNGLSFNRIILNGYISKTQLKKCAGTGRAVLSKNGLKINGEYSSDLKSSQLQIRDAEIENKLCIGQFIFTLKPDAQNEFCAEWEDGINWNSRPIREGMLNITAYAENGIAGDFSIKVEETDGRSSELTGTFKLPFVLH